MSFWGNNPAKLFSDLTLFPSETQNLGDKLNTITRLVLVCGTLLYLCKFEGTLQFILASLVLIYVIYYANAPSSVKENFKIRGEDPEERWLLTTSATDPLPQVHGGGGYAQVASQMRLNRPIRPDTFIPAPYEVSSTSPYSSVKTRTSFAYEDSITHENDAFHVAQNKPYRAPIHSQYPTIQEDGFTFTPGPNPMSEYQKRMYGKRVDDHPQLGDAPLTLPRNYALENGQNQDVYLDKFANPYSMHRNYSIQVTAAGTPQYALDGGADYRAAHENEVLACEGEFNDSIMQSAMTKVLENDYGALMGATRY